MEILLVFRVTRTQEESYKLRVKLFLNVLKPFEVVDMLFWPRGGTFTCEVFQVIVLWGGGGFIANYSSLFFPFSFPMV